MAKRVKSESVADKVKRCLRAKELGQKNYKKADALLDEISLEVEPGEEVILSPTRKVVLHDQFADKSIVWKPCGVRRYELKVIET
jgi:hypothetical protein